MTPHLPLVPRPPPPHPSGTPPARLLVTGPPGSGKSRIARERFEAALRDDGPDAALLVLPTYGQVEHVKRLTISRRGDRPDVRGLLDVSFATFTSVGERLAPGFRVGTLPSRRRRDLLAAQALEAADAPIFRPVRDRPGFRARFLRFVKEWKQTGETPAAAIPRARAAAAVLEDGPRERLVAFLDAWERYEGLLADARTPDHEDALRGLVAALREGIDPRRLPTTLVVDGFEDLSGVETSLLLAAAGAVTGAGGRVLVTLPWDESRAGLFPRTARLRTRLLRDAGFTLAPAGEFARAAAPELARLATRLFLDGPDGAPPEARPAAAPAEPAVAAVVGADPADEWDRIGREILRLARAGVGLRDVGVVVRRLDGVAPLARRVLEGLGIPVRLVGGGESLATEAIVRAVRTPLRLLAGEDGRDERGFDPYGVLAWLRWLAAESGAPVPAAAVDAADLRLRRDRIPASWEELQRDLRSAAAGGLDAAFARLEGLRDPRPGERPSAHLARAIDGLLPLRGIAGLDARGVPIDPAADGRLARARAAKRRLLALVEEADPEGHATLVDLVDDLLAATDEASAEPADRRLDAVSVLDAEEARHWELPVVFVAGLVERSFPLHPREDLFLRDEDREALAARLRADGADDGVAWRTTREAEAGERRLFWTAVTRARDRLFLCRAERDEGGRETTPSFFWRDAALALGLPTDGPDAFGRAPADLDRVAPPLPEVATEHDLRRAVAASLRRRVEGVEAVASDARLAGWLARARRFRRITADPLPAGAVAAFRAATRRLSPSSIQTAVDCPHRFFLAKVACVPDDDAPMGGLGADRRFFGEWIHRALELAVREPTATPEELAATVERSAERLPDDADRAFFVADLRRIVALFREREAAAAASGFVPRPGDVEIAFGESGHEVRLGDGEGAFLLSGRVDRLDTSVGGPGPRRAIVVDYKTSPTATEAAAKRLRRAEELQLALYARALESVRGVSVVGLEHYAASAPVRAATAIEGAEAAFAARREGGKPAVHREPAEFREGTIGGAVRRASAVVARVRRGPDGGSAKDPLDRSRCAKCAYAAICRPDPGRFRLVAERADDRVPDDADDEGDA